MVEIVDVAPVLDGAGNVCPSLEASLLFEAS